MQITLDTKALDINEKNPHIVMAENKQTKQILNSSDLYACDVSNIP